MDVSELQKQQIEQMKRVLLGKILSKEAFERLGRIRLVNPQLAGQAELHLLQIYQTGKLSVPVSDVRFREMLKVLSEKKDFRIKRK